MKFYCRDKCLANRFNINYKICKILKPACATIALTTSKNLRKQFMITNTFTKHVLNIQTRLFNISKLRVEHKRQMKLYKKSNGYY